MRLLVVNPNISESVSELIAAEVDRARMPGTEFSMRTAAFGVEYIETRFESMVAGYAVAHVAASEYREVDAVIVAAFGDPGVPALREALPIPVVGLTEAAMHTAALLGNRIGVVAISSRITAWYRETIEAEGMHQRLTRIRNLDEGIDDIGSVGEDARDRLRRLAWECVTKDGADAIVLAGAPLAGLARSLRDELPVPLIDGIAAAVKQAEALVQLAPIPHRAGSFASPPVKPHAGLPAPIAALLDEPR